jgi:multiple sugar transport system ATP-binding protein
MFVAAFLSQPPINLLQATAIASQDEGIVLDFGGQHLTIPWTDPRSPSFMAGHGSPVVVGIRADALTLAGSQPAAPPPGRHSILAAPVHSGPQPAVAAPAATLNVRLRNLEFHGHEWLAYAEAGIPAIDPGELAAASRPAAAQRPQAADRIRDMLRGSRRAPAENGTRHHADGGSGTAGHHRRADLLFRVSSHRGLTPGQELRLAVDLERIFVFAAGGRRLDQVQR